MNDDVLTTEIMIQAGADRIFDYLVDPELMVRWSGLSAELEPEPGGLYRVQILEDSILRGEYVEVTRPHRVVFTCGWEGSPLIPPGSTRITITLDEGDAGTLVRLRHEYLPSPVEIEKHREGWTHYLTRLKEVAETGGAGPDNAACTHEPKTDEDGA